MSSIVSGFSGKAVYSPLMRFATIGILAGGLAGGLAGLFAGVLAGVSTGVFAGALAGVSTGVFAGVSTGEYGITATITLEWLLFCLLMILLEYLIVFIRIRYQQKDTGLES
ncbi:MAG: hypothetical protein UZ19_OD1000864 [Parcubacteria bacterium OLB19]|nr:MAG: hypothetical protein UZ19_OD1000864 [Parcubacteria bacterium OLB19]